MQILIWEPLLLSLLTASLFNLDANLSSTKFFSESLSGRSAVTVTDNLFWGDDRDDSEANRPSSRLVLWLCM